jgi:hypothetical protein
MKKLTSLLPAAGICLLLGVLFLTTSFKKMGYPTYQDNLIICRTEKLDKVVPQGSDTVVVMEVYPTMKSSSDPKTVEFALVFRDTNGKVITKKPSSKEFKKLAFNYVKYKVAKKDNSIPNGYVQDISLEKVRLEKCVRICVNVDTEEVTYEIVDCLSTAGEQLAPTPRLDSIGRCPPCNSRFALEYQTTMESIKEKVAASAQAPNK